MKRYEEVAAHVQGLVEGGTLRVGERVPSVRALSRQRGVSVSTVTAAYRLLESRGVLEARPQSGFYVRGGLEEVVLPGRSRPSGRARVPRVNEVALQLAEHSRRPDLIPLGNADPWPELLPSQGLLRRLRRLGGAERAVRYGHPAGEVELRLQIARLLVGAGCGLRAEDLLVTNGAFEAVHLAARAVCAPGDTIAVESPCHFILLRLLEALGLKVLELPTCPREGVELGPLSSVLEAGRAQAVLCSPNFHNPLGSQMPRARLRALVELCTRRRVPLIEDDVYGELYFGVERPPVAKAFDTEGWVLHCGSFSKTLCPGYRVGWIAPGRFLEEVQRLKFATNFVTGTPTQLALAGFLREGAHTAVWRRQRRVYATNAWRCRAAVARTFPEGTAISDPQGGIVLWVELPPPCDGLQLYADALAEGISIVPGRAFSAQERFQSCVRLAYPRPWDGELEAAVATLGRLAEGQLTGGQLTGGGS